MGLISACPECAHDVNTYVRRGEVTHCELCGHPVVARMEDPHTREAPSAAILRQRARLAGLHPAPRVERQVAQPVSRWVRFARRVALGVAAAVLGFVITAILMDHFTDRRWFSYDVADLLRTPENPAAPFEHFTALRAHLEVHRAGSSWFVIPTAEPPLRIVTDWSGNRDAETILRALRAR